MLGVGGMGVVYEATQLSLGRTVALKLLAPHLGSDETFAERFRREAMLQAALEHASIVTVYEAGESEDGLFLAMKLVSGTNLKQLILDGLEPERALAILEQIAAALDTAHDAGLIHRDVKPQNILVDARDRAFLADFGLTKGTRDRSITSTGQYLGSLDYVAPEQIRGGALSARSDLYAFATVLYECLAGEVPFPRETEAALLYAHLTDPPPRLAERDPAFPPALDLVLARGLAKDPEQRFASAGELVAAARAALDGDPAAAQLVAGSNGDARDRFGQTLVDPGVLRAAPSLETPARREWPRWLLIGLAAAVPVLAFAGFLLGRAGGEQREPSRNVAAAGPLTLHFTDDWRPVSRAGSLPGLVLEDPITLGLDDRDRPAVLRAGMAPEAEGALALPPAFLAGLVTTPQPETVRLGRLPALRYRGLRHGELDSALTLYVVPTNRGAATIACAARPTPREDRGSSGTARCEDVAATLSIRDARPLALEPDARYGATVDGILARLVKARAPARIALDDAETSTAQQRRARALAAIYRSARRSMSRVRPPLVEAPIHRELVRALDQAVGAYGALSRAARDRDPAAFQRAKANIRGAENSLRLRLAALGKLGYRVG